jgi:hopanoid biosynthesis associated protein HpnK
LPGTDGGAKGERRLIVNADDFGASVAVNAGVALAHESGFVTSATLVAGGAAFDDAVGLLDDLSALGVGVHLTLCHGLPVLGHAAAPTLVDEEGRLPPDAAAFTRRFFCGAISSGDVGRELRAQLARVRDAGVRITHLDSHQHLHHLLGVGPLVIALAREFGIRAVRAGVTPVWPPRRGWLGRQLALRLMAEAFAARARRAGLRTPDRLAGQGEAGALTARWLCRLVAALPPGTTELLCHPATARVEGDPPAFDRPAELAAVTAAEVREAARDAGVRLVNFAAL